MNKTVTITSKNHNPTRFGGIIYNFDFVTNANRTINSDSGSNIAGRIVSDKKFDEECRRNLLARDRQKGLKNND